MAKRAAGGVRGTATTGRGRTPGRSRRTRGAPKRAGKRRVLRARNPASPARGPLDAILDRIIEVETGHRGDGFVNHPADRGGPTMRGVTVPACREFAGRAVSVDEMRALFRCRRGVADCRACEGCLLLRRFYRRQYVERFGFERVADPRLQALLVDWAVTSGGRTPVKALQRALGMSGAAVDGAFGRNTQRALDSCADVRSLYLDVLKARSEFYVNCALNDPKVKSFMQENPDVQLHNLRGWNRQRVLAFLV